LPRLEYQYFKSRNCAVVGQDKDQLNEQDKKELDQIVKLAQQFASADAYVIAVPMWSLSFPHLIKNM
jgi:FMN-dependent NADH-azoreductase